MSIYFYSPTLLLQSIDQSVNLLFLISEGEHNNKWYAQVSLQVFYTGILKDYGQIILFDVIVDR